MEETKKTLAGFKLIQSYEVEISKDLKIEGEELPELVGVKFQQDRFITIVGMSAKEIYDLIGEEHILSITKKEKVFIKK